MKNFDLSLYDILGRLPEDATPEEINRAYKLLAQLYHPDRNPDRKQWSEESMKQLNYAKSILSDPEKRKQYAQQMEKKLKEQEEIRNKESIVTNQNRQLRNELYHAQKSKKDLETAVGLAALAFIIGGLID